MTDETRGTPGDESAADYTAGIDPDATGTDPLADSSEIYDPMRSGLDDVGTTHNDAACIVPWVTGDYQAIEIYLDPIVDDRTESICELATAWSATYRDLDSLADAINEYADGEGLSAAIFPRPAGELSEGVVAVSITAG